MLRLGVGRSLALCVVVAALVSGCGGASDPVARSAEAGTPTSSVPTSSPSSSPSPPSPAELRNRTERAAIPGDAFGSGSLKKDEDNAYAVSVLCGKVVDYEHQTRHRTWSTSEYILINEVHAYPAQEGDRLLAEVREARTLCATYTPRGETVPRKVLDEIDLPAPPASISDRFGYCEQGLGRRPVYLCYAFLARGRFVSVVVAAHYDLAHARQKARSLATTAARSLLRA